MKRLSMRDEYATRTTWRYHNQPFRLIVAAQKPCDFVSRKHLILCVRIFPMGASERVVSGQPRMQEEQETTPGCMHLIDPPVKSKRKEEAMTKVTWLDLAP